MQSPSVKVCPHCGQPALLKDLECLKCGHNYRFDLNDAKAASGAPVSPPPKSRWHPKPLHWAYRSRGNPQASNRLVDIAGWALVLFLLAVSVYGVHRILHTQGDWDQGSAEQHGPTLTYPISQRPGPRMIQYPAPARSSAPTAGNPARPPAPPMDTTDISDYLRFLQEVDRQRVT